jgi:hypothetical protein
LGQNEARAIQAAALTERAVPEPTLLPIAIRVYPQPREWKKPSRPAKQWPCPDELFVFDTESRIEPTQQLTFGSYRYVLEGECKEEALFYADDLPEKDRLVLERYVESHPELKLLSRRQFLKRLYRAVYKNRCHLVGFNLPFDLSRIAYDFKNARGRFAGGFSLGIWTYLDVEGRERSSKYRPRIAIKHIDSLRALKGFTARDTPDDVDLIPEDSTTGKPEKGYKFRGHLLDLRTLAFALTDKSYSLESACEEFGVEHPKRPASRHGEVTEEYIDYNRGDVLATWELAVKLLEEYSRHPIGLQVTKAYSPASIGKAYLRAMGITPILERQPDFPAEYPGYAQTAFYGGRTSAHIRKVAVPVVYVDFLSMYQTVNSLMGLWSFVTANKVKVVDHCANEVERFVKGLRPSDLFKPETWKHLPAFVKIIPSGDILPCRAKYRVGSNDWQVGSNYLYAGNAPNHELWFSLPDIVASRLLSGRIPKIVDAFRVEPQGKLHTLKPIKLRGAVEVNPEAQDFFRVVIEERKRVSRAQLPKLEEARLDRSLKVLANATSYGIYAEMHRQESDRVVRVTCHGIDAKPYSPPVTHPDVAGEYYFSPLASLITGAARLMLALLEKCVSKLGGTYAMEDTDSMAIVATELGGMVPCPGGRQATQDGRSAVKALSWEQVSIISERFAALNPYDRDAVPGSILRIEDDNFDPTTRKQRQLWCTAISAKRYALFLRDAKGAPVLLREGTNNNDDRWSEHGLGHLLNPSDPESEDREWIAQAWQNIIRKNLGFPSQTQGFEDLPAVGRVTVSSPAKIRPLMSLNAGKCYSDQIKPFNFLSTCHVKPFGHPIGTDPERFHLIAPYESDPRKWLKGSWIDQYTGKFYGVTTAGNHGTRQTARVKTYGEILREYEFHAESKCADAAGKPSGKQTVGLLHRRHIRIDQIKCIGKESNSLEDVEAGLIHSAENVYTEYPDPKRDEWETRIRPALKKIPLKKLMKLSGLSRRMLIDARTGRRRPHRKNQVPLAEIIRKMGVV